MFDSFMIAGEMIDIKGIALREMDVQKSTTLSRSACDQEDIFRGQEDDGEES